jgi:hypothetical protein
LHTINETILNTPKYIAKLYHFTQTLKELQQIAEQHNISIKKYSAKTKKSIMKNKLELYIELKSNNLITTTE